MATAGEILLGAVLRAAATRPARVAVVGIAKNAGKTVALNHLIAAAAGRRLGLALASTGRDGEAQDAITELPKPRIHAPAGAWIATARGALPACAAGLAVLQELPLHTALGPVLIARVTRPGHVLLIGPGSRQRLAAVYAALTARAAAAGAPPDLFLVDGSFDRVAAAAPALTGTVVLAAGAAFSPSQAATVAEAAHWLDLLRLPPAPAPWARRLRAPAAPVQWLDPAGGAAALPFPSALAAAPALVEAVAAMVAGQPPGGALAVAGAVTDALLRALILRPELVPRFTLVVRDATCILADRHLWRRFRRQGGQAAVAAPVRVAAVVANPWSPRGRGYDPADFVGALAAVAGGVPVLDLEGGEMHLGSPDPAPRP